MRTATSEASWHPKGLYLGNLTCSQKTGKAAPRKWWSSWGLKAEQALPRWWVKEHSVECNPDGQKGDTPEGLMWASVAGAGIARGSGVRWTRRGSQGWDPAGPCWLWGFGSSSHTDIIGVFKQSDLCLRGSLWQPWGEQTSGSGLKQLEGYWSNPGKKWSEAWTGEVSKELKSSEHIQEMFRQVREKVTWFPGFCLCTWKDNR